jgi:cytochrome c553
MIAVASASIAHGGAAPDTIAQRVTACTPCHGKEGRAPRDGYFPRIAGKPAGYLYNQLLNFRDGRRHYGLMTYLVEHLTDRYLYEMADYFASLDIPYPPPQAPNASPQVLGSAAALVREGDSARKIPACAACHGKRLTGVSPGIPGLLGLSRDYLFGQLGHWRTGERRAHPPDCMAKIAAQLTPQEVDAVSLWLAAQALPSDTKPAARLAGPPPMECGGLTK